MEIRSPQAGIVHELAVHTVGGVVTSAEPIMMIIPDGKALDIEVRVSPAEIDQVHIGQMVRLRFTAFNQRTTPEKRGTINYVSADVSHDPKSRMDYYVATVELNDNEDFTVGDQRILPGMPVEAFITTSKRTALSYFVSTTTEPWLITAPLNSAMAAQPPKPITSRESDRMDQIHREILGLRQGLICTIALLVNLLEERGLLEDGIYLDSLFKALRLIDGEDAASPEARVLKEFVRTLNNIEVFARHIQ
jgi:hypothetical protein